MKILYGTTNKGKLQAMKNAGKDFRSIPCRLISEAENIITIWK